MLEGSREGAQRARGAWADLAVAGLAIGAVVLLLVPLPTWLLDLLLAANLAMSLVLLLVAMQVDHPLRVAAFPTWIVLSTLMRLALNVSSTRLILLQGDAGRVIEAYGELVAGANAIVGGVLFALLTIVQLVVITRGAERVAEVGARFALDGLPGKQMAIDAELRAGTLDARTAEARRQRLLRESQFFGAMDGAMKFVRGDVIASLLMIAVNLLGGFGVGMTQQGLDALTALNRYGLLTIGDGLAAQIPALLVATAAGVLVTRVAGETRAGLGPELATQLLRHPAVLRGVGIVCLLIACVPQMPALPFFAVALACAFFSAAYPHRAERDAPAPIRVRLATDRAHWLPSRFALRKTPFERAVTQVTEQVLRSLGLPAFLRDRAPRLEVDPRLPPGYIELSLRDTVTLRKAVPEPRSRPDTDTTVALSLAGSLRRQAHALLGIEEVHRWLGEAAARSPATVREAVPAKVSVAQLTEVLKNLLREGVPLTCFDGIIEAIAHPESEWSGPGVIVELTALARRISREPLTRALLGDDAPARCLRFDDIILDSLREGLHSVGGRRVLALAPAVARDIVQALRRSLDDVRRASNGHPAPACLLLAPSDLRFHVHELLAETLPELPVVSAEELLPEVELTLVRTVHLFSETPGIPQPLAAS